MRIFFTHTHMDHVKGSFFTPLYNPNSGVRLNAGHLGGEKYDLQGIIGTMLMKDPVFPVPSSLIEHSCSFNDYDCGTVFELGDGVVIKTGKLNHPNGACGYRIEFDGKVIAICTDTEHYEGEIDANVVELARDADIMVYDSAYTDENIPNSRVGALNWQEAIRLPKRLRSSRLCSSITIHRTMTRKWIRSGSGGSERRSSPGDRGEVISL